MQVLKIYHHFLGDQKKILGISARSLNVGVVVHKKSTNEIIIEASVNNVIIE